MLTTVLIRINRQIFLTWRCHPPCGARPHSRVSCGGEFGWLRNSREGKPKRQLDSRYKWWPLWWPSLTVVASEDGWWPCTYSKEVKKGILCLYFVTVMHCRVSKRHLSCFFSVLQILFIDCDILNQPNPERIWLFVFQSAIVLRSWS